MRRAVENVGLLVLFFVVLAVVEHGWRHRPQVSAWLGGGDSRLVDAAVGWLPIGGLLAFVGLVALRTVTPLPPGEKVTYAAIAAPWGLLAATYLWTPLAGDRIGWLDDVSAGGKAFRMGVVVSHWSLAASIVLCFILGVAQIVSPRWQPGNAENERRSTIASSCALAGPSVAALVCVLLA